MCRMNFGERYHKNADAADCGGDFMMVLSRIQTGRCGAYSVDVVIDDEEGDLWTFI